MDRGNSDSDTVHNANVLHRHSTISVERFSIVMGMYAISKENPFKSAIGATR